MSRFQRNNNGGNGRNGSGGGTATSDKKKPVRVIRRWVGGGSVEVAIFEKEIEIQNGSMITYFASSSKSYKDEKGEYQNVSVFNPHELIVLAHALNEAYEWINAQVDHE